MSILSVGGRRTLEELLNSRDMPPSLESGPETSGMSDPISLAEVTEVVGNITFLNYMLLCL